MRATLIILALAAAAVVLLLVLPQMTTAPSNAPAAQPAASGTISAVFIERPYLVAKGTNLAKVEFWAVPTGTNITPDAYQKLGEARWAETTGATQRWQLPIPQNPLLVTEIFAKGLNETGTVVASSSLPLIGASAIYEALWGTTP